MKRALLWACGLFLAWTLGLYVVNPSWPLARRMYVAGWEQIRAYGLDPCRSCPIPDRFR